MSTLASHWKSRAVSAAEATAIPVAILYTFAQRFLVEGLTVGSVKG